MFLGIQEGFQMKVTILEEFAQVGGEGEQIVQKKKTKKTKKKGIHCKESRVGVESMACLGNCRELWMGGSGMCGEGEKTQTTKTFVSHSKEFGLFLGGNGESPKDS